MIVNEMMEKLFSNQKLVRDKGVEEIKKDFSTYDVQMRQDIISKFTSTIAKMNLDWERYHAVLEAFYFIINPEFNIEIYCSERNVVESLLRLLSHKESRVRLSAGELLGALCRTGKGQTYGFCKDHIFNLIIKNLENDFPMEENSEGSRPNSPLSTEIVHDTASWRNLETTMKCLEYMIIGTKENFSQYVNQELLKIVLIVSEHPNRFVREAAFTVCSVLVLYPFQDEESDKTDTMENCDETYSMQLAHNFAKGMADNWSQVRYAASVATRNFLLNISENNRETYFPILLPRICLNRYYVAEGVRLYSQETWQKVTSLKGRILVEKYLTNFIPYYIEATTADNHAVREAACSCVAELATKVPAETVKPFVNKLITALIICFTDDSWPVRDAACLASGNFITYFPEECNRYMEELTRNFFANLEDCISSVRQGGAGSLAAAVKAYGDDTKMKCVTRIEQNLKGLENQKEEVDSASVLERGTTSPYGIYSSAKWTRDNDPSSHSDKQMYSCGSLAPKLSRGGCTDCKFQRAAEPWEKADGSIYLICELSRIPSCVTEVVGLLPLLVEALHLKHYSSHLTLFETVCKVLPIIGKGIGKKSFKESLSLFYDHIIYSLTSKSDLTSMAASQCLYQISQIIGSSILMGRLELHNPNYARIAEEKNCLQLR